MSNYEQFIREQLAQGPFQSADEVVAMALQLLARQQREYQVWVEDVRGKVDEAAQELEQGEGIPLDLVVDQLQDKFRKVQGKAVNAPKSVFNEMVSGKKIGTEECCRSLEP